VARSLANCEFFKKGNILHEASGLCLISEKNGNVDIELRNTRSENVAFLYARARLLIAVPDQSGLNTRRPMRLE